MPTISRSDWLKVALRRLQAAGIEGVRVSPLAEELSVSRGSFYWHFKDRQELLDSLLDYWADEMTESAMRYFENLELDPADGPRVMIEHILKHDLVRYDSAVRAWALYDKGARASLRRVDRRRVSYMTELFVKAGFAPEEAAARGRLVVVYLVGERVTGFREPADARGSRMERRIRLLVTDDSAGAEKKRSGRDRRSISKKGAGGAG